MIWVIDQNEISILNSRCKVYPLYSGSSLKEMEKLFKYILSYLLSSKLPKVYPNWISGWKWHFSSLHHYISIAKGLDMGRVHADQQYAVLSAAIRTPLTNVMEHPNVKRKLCRMPFSLLLGLSLLEGGSHNPTYQSRTGFILPRGSSPCPGKFLSPIFVKSGNPSFAVMV